jgi:hypothetical protein
LGKSGFFRVQVEALPHKGRKADIIDGNLHGGELSDDKYPRSDFSRGR